MNFSPLLITPRNNWETATLQRLSPGAGKADSPVLAM